MICIFLNLPEATFDNIVDFGVLALKETILNFLVGEKGKICSHEEQKQKFIVLLPLKGHWLLGVDIHLLQSKPIKD